MWGLLQHVNEALANAFTSRMCEENRIAPVVALAPNNDTSSREVLRSYLEVVKYLLKKYAKNQTTAVYDAAILRYMLRANMIPKHYADDLVTESSKVADVYNEKMQNSVFIEGAEASMRHSVRHYWAQNTQGNCTNFTFQAEALPPVQKNIGNILDNNRGSCIPACRSTKKVKIIPVRQA